MAVGTGESILGEPHPGGCTTGSQAGRPLKKHEQSMRPEVLAQWLYCSAKDAPMFLPKDGRCWYCYADVFGKGGYTMQDAKSRVLTGCPYCRKSWDD